MKTRAKKQQTLVIGIIAAMYFIAVLSSLDFQLENLWFLTPGIWELEGSIFWKALFMELPFVILRVFPIILFAGLVIASVVPGLSRRRHNQQI